MTGEEVGGVLTPESGTVAESGNRFEPIANGKFLTTIGRDLEHFPSEDNYGCDGKIVCIDKMGNICWQRYVLQSCNEGSIYRGIRNGNVYVCARRNGAAIRRITEMQTDGRVVWETLCQGKHAVPQLIYPLMRVGFARPSAAGMGLDAKKLLLQALKNNNSLVRAEALEELGKEPGNGEITSVVMSALKDPALIVRIAAIQTLNRAGPEAQKALPMLTLLLENEELCDNAAHALNSIGGNGVSILVDAYEKENPPKSAKCRKSIVSALVMNLKYGHPQDPRILATLRKGLKDPDQTIRYYMAEVYRWNPGLVGMPILIPELSATIVEDNNQVARAAMSSIQKMGAAAYPALPALWITTKNSRLRYHAQVALAYLADDIPELIPKVIAWAKQSEDKLLQWNIVSVLGSYHKNVDLILPVLEAALDSIDPVQLDDDRPSVRDQALYSLANLEGAGKKALPRLMKIIGDSNENFELRNKIINQVIYRIDQDAVSTARDLAVKNSDNDKK